MGCCLGVIMAETLVLSNPETHPDVMSYTILEVNIKRGVNPPVTSSITVILLGNTGSQFKHRYEGSVAWNFIKLVNTMNFSSPNDSFNTRILKKLNQDGIKEGTVT